MQKFVLTLANQIQKRLYANYLSYLDECEQDRKEGYRPHYCEHGSNNWTDYDNICGYCEDGVTMRNGVTRREYALAEAKRRVSAFQRATAALEELRALHLLAPFTEEYSTLCREATHFLDVNKVMPYV